MTLSALRSCDGAFMIEAEPGLFSSSAISDARTSCAISTLSASTADGFVMFRVSDAEMAVAFSD